MSGWNEPAVEGLGRGRGLLSPWRTAMPAILKLLLVVVTLVLLSSVGGAAAYTSPVTLPVLYLTARFSGSTAARLLWAVLAAATALETAWVLTFVAMGEVAQWRWLFPSLATVATGAIVFRAHAFRQSSSA